MNQRIFNKVVHINGLKYEFTPYGIRFIKRLISNGWSYSKIGKLLGISQNTIAYRCREYGIDKSTKWVGRKRQYSLDEKYFELIDTPEKAYWVGFLAADGYVNSSKGILELGLQRQDESHIKKFAKAINTNKPIYQKDSKYNGKKYPSSLLRINSHKMVNDLNALGIIERKSLIYSPPTENQIDKGLIKYWILGYLDGDGSISIDKNKRYSLSFVGTMKTLSFIQKFFSTNVAYRNEHNTGKTFSIIYAESKTKEILDYLYDNDAIYFCLERKYKKYIQICDIDRKRKEKLNGD